jgi:probable HAF family extracellular repeat protein
MAVALWPGSGQSAGPAYVATDLGSLGYYSSSAVDVNANGQVIGRLQPLSGGGEGVFSWTQAGGMVDLGTLGGGYARPIGVSDSGQVVGNSQNAAGQSRAFVWTQAGGMVDLGTLPGGASSIAAAVSESGQVVGTSWTATGQARAFSWSQGGGMVDLGTLPGGSSSQAVAVADTGQVVGTALNATSEQRAFSWTQAGGMVDLGHLGGGSSAATALNENGQVVGYSWLAGGEMRAFSWTQAGGMVDLGALPGDMTPELREKSIAVAVNDAGQVIGNSGTFESTQPVNTHAFLWTQAGGMVDLGTLSGLPYTWSRATGISASGQVVGASQGIGTPVDHAFLWTQVGGMIDLGTLPNGDSSLANAINDNDLIVGHSARGPGLGLHATVWQPAPPEDLDTNGDGVRDVLQPDGTPAGSFVDGSTTPPTTGSVVSVPADVSVLVEDIEPDGVRITVTGGGSEKAVFEACGYAGTLKLGSGSVLDLTCGSVLLEVVQGAAEFALFDGVTVVSLAEGASARVSQDASGSPTVENLGGGVVTVTTGGVETVVEPGGSVGAVSPAGLCALTRYYVLGSARWQSAQPVQRAAASALVNTACKAVEAVTPTTRPVPKRALVKAYKKTVDALRVAGWLAPDQATTLKALADNL